MFDPQARAKQLRRLHNMALQCQSPDHATVYGLFTIAVILDDISNSLRHLTQVAPSDATTNTGDFPTYDQNSEVPTHVQTHSKTITP